MNSLQTDFPVALYSFLWDILLGIQIFDIFSIQTCAIP